MKGMGKPFSVLVAMVIAIVALADWLFYGQPVGWTLGLFVVAVVGVIAARGGRRLMNAPGMSLIVALLALAGAMVKEPGVLEFILAGLGIMTLAVTARQRWTSHVGQWLMRWVALAGAGWLQPLRDLQMLQRHWTARGNKANWKPARVAGWVVPVVLSLVFVGLFALANPVISNWLGRAGDWAAQLPQLVNILRVLLWVAIGTGVWALLRYRAPRWRRPTADLVHSGTPTAFQQIISPTFVVRCLVLFNIIFAVQTVLDLYYLSGGEMVPEGMSLKEYARRGAYPLVVTALLAAAFVLITFRPGASGRDMRWARRLVYLWLAQNVMLLATAAWRLNLYITDDQLTRLRIAAAIWMLLVLLGLVYIFFRILAGRSNGWLVQANVLTLAAVLFVCCFINFDGIIATFNVERFIAGKTEREHIDIDYLEHLGPDALPALRILDEHVQADPEVKGNRWLAMRIDEIERAHVARLDHSLRDWRGWTWQRQQLRQFVEAHAGEIASPEPEEDFGPRASRNASSTSAGQS